MKSIGRTLRFNYFTQYIYDVIHLLFQLFKNKEKGPVKEEAIKFSSAPNGLYLFGSVGTGKTMMMDLFHDTSSVEKKKRLHFHEFMLDVHRSKYYLLFFMTR